MDWPASRFEAFYVAFQKRKSAESVIQHKNEMVTAFWANSAFAEDAKARSEAIQAIEDNCNEAIEIIYNGVSSNQELDLESNPFMSASKRGLQESGVPDVEKFSDFRDNVDNDFDENSDSEVDQD